MLNVFVKFKNDGSYGSIDPTFVQAKDWDDFENKLSNHFNEKEDDMTVTYFNFMVVDSDFQRDYDAEISIHYNFDDSDGTFSRNYQVDFDIVKTIL